MQDAAPEGDAPGAPEPPKRKAGRPAKAAGAGAWQRVNVTLYQEHIDIAKRIDSNVSAAVRQALDYWADQHPDDAGATGTS